VGFDQVGNQKSKAHLLMYGNKRIWNLVQMAGQISRLSGKTSKFKSPTKARWAHTWDGDEQFVTNT